MSSVMSLLNEIGDGPPHFLQRCRITFMPPTFTHGSERESTESYLLWFGDNWDSVEQIRNLVSSPEYQKAREIGNKYASFLIVAVEGIPPQ